MPRGPTHTSSFGVSRREAHDASSFYARFVAPELSEDDQVHFSRQIDRIFSGDARSMTEVPDKSVALVVTSPPYFAGKQYEEALGTGHIPGSYLEYLKMLEEVFAECVHKLEPGGRIAVNVANLGRRPYRSLSSDVTAILQDKLRLLLRGEVIWQKGRGATGNCAWGSFQKPANPVLRDLTERVIIASKGRFDRALTARERSSRSLPSDASVSKDEFMEATTDIWEIPPESATRVGHPAPFPVELPERLIHLYTYYGDLVLDPFVGSGTTAVAALRTGRHFAGYDVEESYAEKARERIEQELVRLKQAEGTEELPASFVLPAVPEPATSGEDLQARAVREGRAAREIAGALIEQCGFVDVRSAIRLAQGVEMNFRAYDQTGGLWYFDVSGGFTSNRPGLRRTDTLWKALGKAAVLHQAQPQALLGLLTTHAPLKGSAGDKALRVMWGRDKPIAAVIEMTSRDDQARLRRFASGEMP
jgi:DNA modification methylase